MNKREQLEIAIAKVERSVVDLEFAIEELASQNEVKGFLVFDRNQEFRLLRATLALTQRLPRRP